jgi:hypothetical protein
MRGHQPADEGPAGQDVEHRDRHQCWASALRSISFQNTSASLLGAPLQHKSYGWVKNDFRKVPLHHPGVLSRYREDDDGKMGDIRWRYTLGSGKSANGVTKSRRRKKLS